MSTRCPKKWALERFFAEGSPAGPVADHAAGCPSCRETLTHYQAQKAAFLAKHPFRQLWNALEERRASRRFWRKWLLPVPLRTAVAFASIAGLIVFAVWRHQQSPEILTKGGVGLGFYVSSQGKIEKGRNGMSLRPGTEVQFLYSSQKESYLLLAGIEEDGTVTFYYPPNGEASGPIEPAKKSPLPTALRWRPAGRYERFFALFTEMPIPSEEFKAAAEGLGKTIEQEGRFPLPYPQVSIILYRKDGK